MASAIRYSRGATKYDNCPEQREAADFDAFTDAVLGDRATAKGRTYVCAPMAEGCHNEPEKYPGMATWRQKRLTQSRAFLPLDLDAFDKPETFAQLREWLGRFKGFGYTTASHTPEAPRCRIVLAQTRETNREEGAALCKAVQAMIERELGAGRVKFDESVYKAEQPLYTPLVDAETFRFDGLPVDVDAVLAQGFPKKPDAQNRNNSRMEQVKTNDLLLAAMIEIGMVRSDQGNGKFYIDCPFADQHTVDSGDSETVYYLAHTGGFANSHFHCMHAHCAQRTDMEFMAAIIARYERERGKPPFVLNDFTDIPPPKPKTATEDVELKWLTDNAPPPMGAYIRWYMENAIRPHPVFALMSALLFIQAMVGLNIKLPSELRPNLWMLLLAPTESGKGDVPRLATVALEQIQALKMLPAIPRFERAFGSAEGLWWYFEDNTQAIWFDEELGKTLAAMIAAPEGTPRYDKRQALLTLHDAATKAHVPPIHYSKRAKSANEMAPLHHPFLSIVGTGVPRDIGSFSAAAADDGLLNRFLVVVVEDLPAVGSIKPPTLLRAEIVKWAKTTLPKNAFEVMEQATKGSRELEVYEGLGADWAREMDHGSVLAQDLPGVWGRYAEKVLQAAMIYAVADTGKVTPASFEWAKRLVRWALSDFAHHFAAEGGGAENELDALAKAFMAVFNKPSLAGKDVLPSSYFSDYSRKWRVCKDSWKRQKVINALKEDGLIEEVPLQPKGMGYRKIMK